MDLQRNFRSLQRNYSNLQRNYRKMTISGSFSYLSFLQLGDNCIQKFHLGRYIV